MISKRRKKDIDLQEATEESKPQEVSIETTIIDHRKIRIPKKQGDHEIESTAVDNKVSKEYSYLCESHGEYVYFNIPSGSIWRLEEIELFHKHLLEVVQEKKKALISLPPDFKVEKKFREQFFKFFEEEINEKYIFIFQNGLHWSEDWHIITAKDIWITDDGNARRWAKGKISKGKVKSTLIGDIVYLHCSGALHDCLSLLDESIEKALEVVSLKGELGTPLNSATSEDITSWSFLHGAIVIDFTNVFLLNQEFFSTFKDILAKRDLNPLSKGIYFVTSGLFQSWQLKQGLNVDNLQEVGNIIRTVPEKEVSFDDIIKVEVRGILKACVQQDPPIVLLIHQVQGADKTISAMRYFTPEFILCDEIVDAREIKSKLKGKIQPKVFHTTPASDPGLMMLAPSLITQGYDIKLFADYILSQYQNNRGRPNETFIYYFDSVPENYSKILGLVQMEFSHVLNEEQIKVLEGLEKCETVPHEQGSFLISLLGDQILNFDVNLNFTEKGTVDFFLKYPEIFPHHIAELFNSLRIFVKKEPSEKKTEVKLHLIDDYNEITVKQEGFLIEARFQEDRAILSIKSLPDESLERRCFSIFSLLSTSNIFDQLPNKEILIDLISLLWENFTASTADKSHGFLITLIASPKKCILKIFQNENNRALIKAERKDEQPFIDFSGEIIRHKTTVKRFLKPISLFFSSDNTEKEEKEKNWRFACFEAISALVANSPSDETVCFDFRILGDLLSAAFLSEPKKVGMTAHIEKMSRDMIDKTEHGFIQASTLEKIKKGVDKLQVLEQGRQIFLVKNLSETKEEIDSKESSEKMVIEELHGLQENTMVQEIEDVKAKEVAARSARLQDVYAQALAKMKIKEDEFEEDKGTGKENKGIVQATSKRRPGLMHRKKETDLDKKFKKTMKIAISSFAFLALIGIGILIWYIAHVKNIPKQPTPQQVVTQYIPPPPPQPVQKPPVDQENARKFLLTLFQQLRHPQVPTQLKINEIIKIVYFNVESYESISFVGDIYNIYARLYYYKVFLDKEPQLFEDNWKRAWIEESYRLFQKAKAAYSDPKAETYFCLMLMPWMPEKDYTNEKFVIKYSSPQKALEDIEAFIAFIKKNM